MKCKVTKIDMDTGISTPILIEDIIDHRLKQLKTDYMNEIRSLRAEYDAAVVLEKGSIPAFNRVVTSATNCIRLLNKIEELEELEKC